MRRSLTLLISFILHNSILSLSLAEPLRDGGVHAPGTCSLYGFCGIRAGGDPMPCPVSQPAVAADERLAAQLQAVCPSLWDEHVAERARELRSDDIADESGGGRSSGSSSSSSSSSSSNSSSSSGAGDSSGRWCCTEAQVLQIAKATRLALPFIAGCPACTRNFMHFWCALTCSPDQSTFMEVTAVQPAVDTKADVVAEVSIWVSEHFASRFYDSCSAVKLPKTQLPAMSFIGGAAKTPQEFLDFLGLVKDKRFPPIGSPYQQNFLSSAAAAGAAPPGVVPLPPATAVTCGGAAVDGGLIPSLSCNCTDCPPDASTGCLTAATTAVAAAASSDVGSSTTGSASQTDAGAAVAAGEEDGEGRIIALPGVGEESVVVLPVFQPPSSPSHAPSHGVSKAAAATLQWAKGLPTDGDDAAPLQPPAGPTIPPSTAPSAEEPLVPPAELQPPLPADLAPPDLVLPPFSPMSGPPPEASPPPQASVKPSPPPPLVPPLVPSVPPPVALPPPPVPVDPAPSAPPPSPVTPMTAVHAPGFCATYDNCGKRKDGDPLACPANVEAQAPSAGLAKALEVTCPSLWAEAGGTDGKYCCSEQQAARIGTDTQRAIPFLVSCPACLRNFLHFWCVLSCHPDQSTFMNVTAVQRAYDTNATVVAETDVWVSEDFGSRFYNSCKDVKFGALNVPSMNFIGGGAKNYQEWFDFLGMVKDKRFPLVGSPFQQNFPPASTAPPPESSGVSPMVGDVVSCGDNALRCSCADCPAATGCAQPDPSKHRSKPQCRLIGDLVSCYNAGLGALYLLLCAATVTYLFYSGPVAAKYYELNRSARDRLHRSQWPAWWRQAVMRVRYTLGWPEPAVASHSSLGSDAPLPLSTRWGSLAALSGQRSRGSATAGEASGEVALSDLPVIEQWLRRRYFDLGLMCALHPMRVVLGGVVLVLLCCSGLFAFRLETDPQRLWVGPGSQAAQEKAAYEASFGPFYRIEQLIISTRPLPLLQQQHHHKSAAAATAAATATLQRQGSSAGRGNVGFSFRTSASGGNSTLPPILTTANLEALFAMQAEIDAIAAPVAKSNSTASLRDVCFKPMGTECATQSVLQFWKMDRDFFEREQAKSQYSTRLTPDYCCQHWFTECRSAFEAPVDPHVVLGGFPLGEAFRSYSADATAFVVTFPVRSDEAVRPAALAWEAAFVDLSRTRLADIAAQANLSLSFSTERSVQDELRRESTADAVTVAASYGVMLMYITLALGALPSSAGRMLDLLVLSRASLGLGGVLIVAASVAGALGLISAMGLWSTLIVMEVIPFLILAVGVDNMFIITHALAKQNALLPLPHRVASALSSAGPSITLAAVCECLAFAAGALLTPMPAVRNFSACASLAVLLDFILQMTVFVALLSLDTLRIEQRALDLLPCIRLPAPKPQPKGHVRREYGGVRDDQISGGHESTPGSDEDDDSEQRGGGGGGFGKSSGRRDGGGDLKEPLIPHIGHSLASMVVPVGREGCVGGGAGGRGGAAGGIVTTAELDASEGRVSLQGALQWYMEKVHAPALARRGVQAGVLLLFLTGLFLSLASLPHLSVGLDQAVALPRDSYLQDYFHDVFQYLRVGPPLLFVVEDLNLSRSAPDINRVCSISGCDPNSLLNQVSQAALDPGDTYIATGAASWVDDFMSWLSPSLPKCCRLHSGDPEGTHHQSNAAHSVTPHRALRGLSGARRDAGLASSVFGGGPAAGSYCPPPDQEPCAGNASACGDCHTCITAPLEGGRPDVGQFQQLLPAFLSALPSEQCAKGGAGVYSDALQREALEGQNSARQKAAARQEDTRGPVAGLSRGVVQASAFRAYYVPLNSQPEFIGAMTAVREFVSSAAEELGLKVYAYSLFHIFFEQYLSIGRDCLLLLGAPLAVIFATSWLLTGSLWQASLLLVVLSSLLVDLMGVMVLAGIQLNAVSLVNLGMALGIAVEFCAHIVHTFGITPLPGGPAAAAGAIAMPTDGRVARMVAALRSTGASVLSGITLTKLLGVSVLAFAQTQIFEVYYFRLYLGLVILGALHGLVLLPVLLALAGPPPWSRRAALQPQLASIDDN